MKQRFRTVLPLLEKHLLVPVEEFVSRPSKALRASLVAAGYEAAKSSLGASRSQNFEPLAICSQVIELLHAGSLIVDDFQDASQTRRGKPCFHRLYGAGQAINSGNWLYVWPLRLIASMQIEADRKRLLEESYVRAIEAAHYGQALDLGVKVDELNQEEVLKVCQWVTRHKTGALTILALELGAIVVSVF